MFEDYYQVRDWLEEFIPFTYSKENLGLARIKYLLKLLGNPQEKFKSIHVAGTSGKGSVAFYISRMLQLSVLSSRLSDNSQLVNQLAGDTLGVSMAATLHTPGVSKGTRKLSIVKVGLHLSPHLVYIGERMQINGEPISVKCLIGLISQIRPIVERIKKTKHDLTPSYFEILVAASFLYFAQEKIDWVVVEVGLGGRLDATNVLQPELCVITNVGLDHMDILGKSIEKIAYEKAGIIKESKSQRIKESKNIKQGVPVVTAARGKALEVIEKVAKEKKASLITINIQREPKGLKSDIKDNLINYYDILRHRSQNFVLENVLLAITALDTLGFVVTRSALKRVLSLSFAGRFEQIDRNLVLDGAHNPDKIRALLNFIGKFQISNFKFQIILVVAFKKGKEWKSMLDLLIKNLPIEAVIATKFYAVTDTGRFGALDSEEIAKYIRDKEIEGQRIKVYKVDNSQEAVFEALRLRSGQAGFTPGVSNGQSGRTPGVFQALVLVTGSLYLVGEVRTLWHLPEF